MQQHLTRDAALSSPCRAGWAAGSVLIWQQRHGVSSAPGARPPAGGRRRRSGQTPPPGSGRPVKAGVRQGKGGAAVELAGFFTHAQCGPRLLLPRRRRREHGRAAPTSLGGQQGQGLRLLCRSMRLSRLPSCPQHLQPVHFVSASRASSGGRCGLHRAVRGGGGRERGVELAESDAGHTHPKNSMAWGPAGAPPPRLPGAPAPARRRRRPAAGRAPAPGRRCRPRPAHRRRRSLRVGAAGSGAGMLEGGEAWPWPWAAAACSKPNPMEDKAPGGRPHLTPTARPARPARARRRPAAPAGAGSCPCARG